MRAPIAVALIALLAGCTDSGDAPPGADLQTAAADPAWADEPSAAPEPTTSPRESSPNTTTTLEWDHAYAADTCTPICYGITSVGNEGPSGFSVSGNSAEVKPILVEFWWNATTEASRELTCTILLQGEVVEEWIGASPVMGTPNLAAGTNYTLRTHPVGLVPAYVSQTIHLRVTGEIVEWSPLNAS